MVEHAKSGFEALAKGRQHYPKEALLEIRKANRSLQVGMPAEIALQENRVPLAPEGVQLLVNNGHSVVVETGAGKAARLNDKEYSDAGAKIAYSHKEIFETDLVIKVEPPTFEEISFLKPSNTLISALQTGNLEKTYFEKLNAKKTTALAYELMEDKVGGMPLMRAMSEIAGSTVMLIAAEYLSSVNNGKGIILGGITGVPPTKVIILGAGTVAEFAARAALGLGVDIQVYDNHQYKLRRIKHALGQQVFTSTLEPTTLRRSLQDADVVIGAMRKEKGKTPFLVTDDMVSQMKPGSVIIDVSIDQGGCFETSRLTTHEKPIYTRYGVIHYCVPNIASRVAQTATMALNNIFTPILLQIPESGGIDEMMFNHRWFLRGVYAYRGYLTNQVIADKIGLKSKDLNLFMAARL